MIHSSVVFLCESGRTHWSWQTTRNFLRHFNQTISFGTTGSCFVCCMDVWAARRWCTVTPWPVAPLDKRPPPVAAARTNLTTACAFCCYGNRSTALSTTNCWNYWSAEHFSFERCFVLSISDGGRGLGGGQFHVEGDNCARLSWSVHELLWFNHRCPQLWGKGHI